MIFEIEESWTRKRLISVLVCNFSPFDYMINQRGRIEANLHRCEKTSAGFSHC